MNAYKKHRNADLIASMFAVASRIVYRLVAQKCDTGSVELCTSQWGRKLKLNEDYLRQINELVKQKLDITLFDIQEELKLECSESTLNRVICFKLGYSLKRKVIHTSKQKRPWCEGKREQWKDFAAKHERDKLVFLDESGINTNMTRRYGRTVGKARVIDHDPCNTPKNTTIVSSM